MGVTRKQNQNDVLSMSGLVNMAAPIDSHLLFFESQYKEETRKCVYETLCPQLVSHFQHVKMSKK